MAPADSVTEPEESVTCMYEMRGVDRYCISFFKAASTPRPSPTNNYYAPTSTPGDPS